MILLIDNYDSFTYNLVQRLGEVDAGLEIQVHRNDQISCDEIEAKRPTQIGFALWMALARATPVDGWRLDDAQMPLAEEGVAPAAGGGANAER